MPNIKVVDMAGKEVSALELSDKVFGASVNEAVLHTAVRAYLLNQRQGTQSTLTRTEVSGGGRKPWKQKGTGHARQGSTRSPQWVHGGIALGPKPRSYRVNLNKAVKRTALFSALSSKVAGNEMVVIDNITATEYKTKNMVEMLSAVGAAKKTLIVLIEQSDVIDFVFEHGNTLYSDTERESGVFFCIDAADFQHIRMNHPASEYFDPTFVFANTATVTAANKAGYVNFTGGLGKREVMRTEAGFCFGTEHSLCELRKNALQIAHSNALIDYKAFELMEHGRVCCVNSIGAVNTSGGDYSERNASFLHRTYLNG